MSKLHLMVEQSVERQLNFKIFQLEKISKTALLEGGEYSEGVIKGYQNIKEIKEKSTTIKLDAFKMHLEKLIKNNKNDSRRAVEENDYWNCERLRGEGVIYSLINKTLKRN